MEVIDINRGHDEHKTDCWDTENKNWREACLQRMLRVQRHLTQMQSAPIKLQVNDNSLATPRIMPSILLGNGSAFDVRCITSFVVVTGCVVGGCVKYQMPCNETPVPTSQLRLPALQRIIPRVDQPVLLNRVLIKLIAGIQLPCHKYYNSLGRSLINAKGLQRRYNLK